MLGIRIPSSHECFRIKMCSFNDDCWLSQRFSAVQHFSSTSFPVPSTHQRVKKSQGEKMELKKGSWSNEEDNILINYIRTNGHTNWRALPKHAGLLRCGKSCRLRWMNYLRPDIKRGNFTQEEEETVINLHEMLGNKWSAIAARLPGRTDNEIKNVWHSQLKRRLNNLANHGPTMTTITTTIASGMATDVAACPTMKRARKRKANGSWKSAAPKKLEPNDNNECVNNVEATCASSLIKIEPRPCTSEVSTVTSSNSNSSNITTTYNHTCPEENAGGNNQDFGEDLVDINDEFWMEILSIGNTSMSNEDVHCMSQLDDQILDTKPMIEPEYSNVDQCEVMDVLWHNYLAKSQDLLEITDML